MGGQKLADGNLGFLHHPDQGIQSPAARAHVQVNQAGLTSEHATDPCLGRDAAEFVIARLGRAMVGYGHLAYAYHLGDEGKVFPQAPRDGGKRQLVGAAVYIS